MPDYENAKSINRKLNSASKNWAGAKVFRRYPDLKGQIASHLDVALGNAEIDYLTVEVNETDFRVGILAFAGLRIVWLTTSEETCVPSTSILSTRHIESIELVNVSNVMTSTWGESDALNLEVEIGGTTFSLPADSGATESNVAQLKSYLPALMEHLAPVA
ncbi:hypothetical protein [Cryobacterium zongtaii]|uniref:hypothetical protein n=1 Tax=Cryobacterium zongtaii TaxID=1259217 RepID=UPI001057260D|nr:hypothetical protein [Cryobacterium zongtaii]